MMTATTDAADQPCAGTSMRAKTPPDSPAVTNAAPYRSKPAACGSRLSGTYLSVVHTAATASGRLMKNTQRHDAASTSQPPTNGPIAPETPDSPAQTPTARPRSSWSTEASIRARLPGTSRAPATPWITRAATSAPAVGARPHANDPSENPARPIT